MHGEPWHWKGSPSVYLEQQPWGETCKFSSEVFTGISINHLKPHSCHYFLYPVTGGQSGADLVRMRNYCRDAAETFPRELPWLTPKLLQLCLLESFSFTGKLFSNCNQAPTANLLKAACNLLVRSNETSSNLACFILLQLGNILSNREGQNLCTERAKGFRKLRAANNSLKIPALHDGAELYKTGTISNKWFSELRFWRNSSRCLPAAKDQEGRTWNFKTSTGDWYKPSCREFQQLKSGSHLSIISG